MNQKEVFRQQAQVDSRRVASGFMCTILADKYLLGILVKNGFTPEYVSINPETGYDKISGNLIVLAKHKNEDLQDLLKKIPSLDSLNLEIDNLYLRNGNREFDDQIAEKEYLRKETESILLHYLRENCFLVHISGSDPGGPPNKDLHNVYLDTREDGPPTATLVRKLGGVDQQSNLWRDRVK